MRRLAFLITVVLLLAACAAPPAAPRPDRLEFADLAFKVPSIEPLLLPNGIRLYLHEDRELPLVTVTAMVGAGSIGISAERDGQGGLFATLLEEGGAGELSPTEFEERLEDLAMNFSAGVDAYATTIGLSLLSEDLDAGLAIMEDVLRRPRFDADRLELARKQMLEAIRRQDDNPQSVLRRAFDAAVYGEHPFGRSPTQASVNKVERRHLTEFHRRHFVPQNLWLAISGDFDRDVLERKLRARFADWQGGGAYVAPAIPPLSDPVRADIWLADKDIPQTAVMIGGVGISKDNPDMLTVRVMNAILGGSGFNSRLMREIRSNRGLAYSVYSYYMIGRRLPGSFIASGETANATAMQMVRLMLDEMQTIRTELVSEAELALAKQSRINSFVFAFDDSHDVLTQQMRLDFYGYPPGYLETYRQKVMAISREEILRVAQTYLQPDKMAIVLVGKPQGVEAAAAELQRQIRTVPRTP